MEKENNSDSPSPLVDGCKWDARPWNNHTASVQSVVNAEFARVLEQQLIQARKEKDEAISKLLEILSNKN